MYQERSKQYFDKRSFKPIGICKVIGITKTDILGDYIPSIYDVKTLNVEINTDKTNQIPQTPKIDYIIDYIGSYYMQLKKGETFESVGMLEEIYYDNQPSGKYRLSLNHWDGHIANNMYLKTIAKAPNTFIKEKGTIEANDNYLLEHIKYKGR